MAVSTDVCKKYAIYFSVSVVLGAAVGVFGCFVSNGGHDNSWGRATPKMAIGGGNRRAFLKSGGSLALGAFALRNNLPAFAAAEPKVGGKPVKGDESIMAQKAHGTSAAPVQKDLRWNVDVDNADRITNFNRHYAERAGYWKQTDFLKEVSQDGPTTYYDSVTGKPLFVAPIGRSMKDFLDESNTHGWPSFRDQEVVWENARVLKDGETVSATGTHLGHNLPDRNGNRYCINLVSIAGRPA